MIDRKDTVRRLGWEPSDKTEVEHSRARVLQEVRERCLGVPAGVDLFLRRFGYASVYGRKPLK